MKTLNKKLDDFWMDLDALDFLLDISNDLDAIQAIGDSLANPYEYSGEQIY